MRVDIRYADLTAPRGIAEVRTVEGRMNRAGEWEIVVRAIGSLGRVVDMQVFPLVTERAWRDRNVTPEMLQGFDVFDDGVLVGR